MGTTSAAYALHRDKRSGIYTIRFRFGGKRFHRTTGCRDRGEAQKAASRIIDEVMRRGRAPLARGPGPDMASLFGAWIHDRRAHRSELTAKELERYADTLFLDAFPALRDVNEASLSKYMGKRLETVSASSVRKELSALSTFVRYCALHGFMDNPPKVPRVEPRVLGTPNAQRVHKIVKLTDAQASALLAALPVLMRRSKSDGSRYPLRDVYTLIWETGLRMGTIARLETPKHWRPGAEFLDITADIDKARYARSIPVTDAARAILDAHSLGRSGIMFGPKAHQGSMLAAGKAIGLSDEDARKVGPHDVRHAAITHMANSGAPLASVAYLVGHKTVAMTARYIHTTKESAAAALAMRRPLGH